MLFRDFNAREIFQLVLGIAAQDEVVIVTLNLVDRYGNVMLAHAQEATGANDIMGCLMVIIHDDIPDVAYLVIIFIPDGLAHDVIFDTDATNRFLVVNCRAVGISSRVTGLSSIGSGSGSCRLSKYLRCQSK